MIILLAISVLTLLLIDCRQTLRIKYHPNMWEINPFLGEHPTDAFIICYFIFCAVFFTASMIFLPFGYAIAWGVAWLIVEAGVVWHNYNKGLGLF